MQYSRAGGAWGRGDCWKSRSGTHNPNDKKIRQLSLWFSCIHELFCSFLKFKCKIFNSMVTYDVQHRSTYIYFSRHNHTCDNTLKIQLWIPLKLCLRNADWDFHLWISASSSASPYYWNLIVTLIIYLLLRITFKAFHCLWHDRVSKMLTSLYFFPQSLSFSVLEFGISFLNYIRCQIRNSYLILRYIISQGFRCSLNSVFNHYHF